MLSLKKSVLTRFFKSRSRTPSPSECLPAGRQGFSHLGAAFLERDKSRLFSKVRGKDSSFFIGLSVVGAVLLVSLVAVFFNPFRAKEATLLLAFENDGQGRMFVGEVVSGMTILDALLVSSEAGQIKLRYHLEQDGKLVIEELDGYTAGTLGRELAFYLNGQKVLTKEINRVAIRSRDKIEVHIE